MPFARPPLASARVIERDGRRIGYVHVWASVGEESGKALQDALAKLGRRSDGPVRPSREGGDGPSRRSTA